MATRVIPTFFLKGVDPHKLLKEYNAGNFGEEQKQKITIARDDKFLAPSYGTDNNSPIFCVKDRNNCSVVVATSGHSNLEVYTKSGGELPTGGRCMRCLRDFETIVIGYPVAYKEETLLMNDNDGESRYRIIYVFWVEGTFCSFECALGHIQQVMARPVEYRDTTLKDAERLLKFLYKLTYPNSGHLRPSQDPLLLACNGGSLTYEEWSDENHVYLRTDRVLVIPAKVEYIRLGVSPIMTIDFIRDAGGNMPTITST